MLCYFSHSSALRVYAGFGLVVRSLCLAYADVVPALLAQGLLVALAPAFATSSTAPLRARRPSPSRLSALSALALARVAAAAAACRAAVYVVASLLVDYDSSSYV